MHNHRPLVKPMVIVTTTGYIVSILGSYLADSKNNDASILQHNISSNVEHMKDWLQEDDLLVVDRGFRDSLDFLNDLGLKCKMPPFLNKGQKQQPTEEVLAANTNALQNRVQEEQLDRRTREWKPLDGATSVMEFPTLSEEEFRHITIGVYQLKLALFYASEHLNEDGDFNIMVNDEEDGMLRARIQSRHTSVRSYLLWIEYNPAVVTAWYCQCKIGSRIVGTCAHISAVIWYLGYARHLGGVFGVKDWSSYIEDAANMPQFVDESDSQYSDPEE